MKTMGKFLGTAVTGLLFAGLTLNFNACTEQSPLQSSISEADVSLTTLGKAGGNGNGEKQADNAYPQSTSRTYTFKSAWNKYTGGNLWLPNGSSFHLTRGALIPPPGTPQGADVTITMQAEKGQADNELVFTFGPSGCQFNPPAEVWLDYSDLQLQKATLYLIEEDGTYTEQAPYNIDSQGQRMSLLIHHFSRYALAWSR